MRHLATYLCVSVLAAVLAICALPDSSFARSDEADVVPGELVVVIEDGTAVNAEGAAREIVADADGVVDAEVIEQPADAEDIVKVELSDDADAEQVQSDIGEIPGVASVQPNYVYHQLESEINGFEVSDPKAALQYHLGSFASSFGVNAKAAWTKARCGTSAADSKVTVAVLDSGFMFDHVDLKANIVKEFAWDSTRNARITASSTKNSGHGTHVVGIVSAAANNAIGVAGVSFNAKVIPVKVFTDGGVCTSIALAQAYSYLLDLVDKGKVDDLHVINMSLGNYGGVDTLVKQRIKRARDEYDIVSVCAGGNGNEESGGGLDTTTQSTARTDMIYPADLDTCVSVTALNTDGTDAPFSDYNRCKDISAPGVKIASTYDNGGYATGTGTSTSAPIVSGALALLWAKNPYLTVDQALKALYATAVDVVDSEFSHKGATGSHGCVDAAAALDYIDGLVPIKGCSIKVSKATFTGKALKPKTTVVLAGRGLVQGRDYKVRYKNNKGPGTATVYVSGKGKYTGLVAKKFKIVLPAKVKKVKKSKVKRLKLSLKTPRRIKVTYKKVAKATGYQIKYAKSGSGTWKKVKTKKRRWTTPKLKPSSRYRVKVRPYIKYGGKVFYGKWSASRTIATH